MPDDAPMPYDVVVGCVSTGRGAAVSPSVHRSPPYRFAANLPGLLRRRDD